MALSERDKQRLTGIHPTLIKALDEISEEMDANETPIFVTMGVRTAQEQAMLWSLGRTIPGKVVTMKDGYLHKSNHQPAADGFGRAADLAFVGPAPFADTHPWERLGEAIERPRPHLCLPKGLVWGGRWKHPHDSPHAELPSDFKGESHAYTNHA